MKPSDRDRLVQQLLSISREAVQAARIEHRPRLLDALQLRERILASLWGFDPDSPLPEYSPELAKSLRQPEWDPYHAEFEELRQLDQRLMAALDQQKQRLKHQDNLLQRGEQYMRGMRTMAFNRPGAHFDSVG